MYECTICLSLNHSSRIHCQNCGTIPAMYSIIGKPSSSQLEGVEVICAHGAVHACKHHASRLGLRTVALDYYAE
jgi:hypothetical protein